MIDSNKWFNEAKELEKQLEEVKLQLALAMELIATAKNIEFGGKEPRWSIFITSDGKSVLTQNMYNSRAFNSPLGAFEALKQINENATNQAVS